MKNPTYLYIGAFLLLLWLFFKKKKPNSDDYEQSNFQYNGVYATISTGKATTIATQLKEEFANWNSDEDYIVSLFHGLNEADYILIYEAFGLETLDPLTGASSIYLGFDYNLTEWLIHVLDDEISVLENQFSSIF